MYEDYADYNGNLALAMRKAADFVEANPGCVVVILEQGAMAIIRVYLP